MNLKELAAEFGVSPSTISRVVNQSKNFSVSAELRGRILARAAELGYAPNPMYQAMRKKDNRQISILFPYLLHIMGGADISKGIDCLSEELFRLGYSSHYLSCPQEQRRNYGVPPWKVAGAVAVDVRLPGQIAELDASGIPYVSLNGIAGPNGASVLVDERANTFLLLDYLYGLGHRRIGYVSHYRSREVVHFEFQENHYSVVERAEAYLEFCRERELMPLLPGLDSDHNAAETVDGALAQGATAFVTYAFTDALRVEYLLRKRGLRVPEDVSVAAFNNPKVAAFVNPALTCIEIPVGEMGRTAARLLLDKINKTGDPANASIRLVGKLHRRDSVAPCRRKKMK